MLQRNSEGTPIADDGVCVGDAGKTRLSGNVGQKLVDLAELMAGRPPDQVKKVVDELCNQLDRL